MSELKQTDLSKRLRELAQRLVTPYETAKVMLDAAEEIERYYTGMLNWKATAEAQCRAQPEANADAKDALLLRLRYYVDSKSQEYGYGFYRPGNPHDFTPDADQCSDDEIAAHKAACEAYDKGEYTHDHSGCIREGGMHILHAPWGIGSYIFRDPEVQELLDQIDAVRPSTPTTDAPQAKESEVNCADQG